MVFSYISLTVLLEIMTSSECNRVNMLEIMTSSECNRVNMDMAVWL